VTIARTVPQTLAQERFLALTYPGHGYGRLLPTPEQLKGYGAEQVRAFHAAGFGARRAHLYVAGRFDAAAAERAIRAAFAGFPAGTPRAPRPPQPASRRAVNLVDRPGAVQSAIYVGLPALDPRSPDYLPLVVTNTLLGGYFSSRMVANLREAKGYTYSPHSMLAVRAGGPGFWAQVADVTTAVTGASLKEIFLEIDRLRSEPPAAAEVQAVQAYLAGQFLLQTSRREGLIERLRFVDLNRLPDRWLADYVQAIRAVTPAQVQEMARRWLDGGKMTVVVVGDRKEVEGQVKPYGELVVGSPRS
jgi:predicted Zn-dependent peptidase